MRNAFAAAVLERCNTPETLFLTGDLGFMALEKIRDAYGSRFVNMGVSEQNMVGVAAGLAREGLRVLVYSIAPFVYARPFEQVRNDICLPQLPVCLVGNGGGYAYGYMGPTHHALEDCAAMCALGVRVLVPAFDDDVAAMLVAFNGPSYLRLGYDVRPQDASVPAYAPWRELLVGDRGVLLALGPLAGVAWSALASRPMSARPSVWAVTELPVAQMPERVVQRVAAGAQLYVVEEHVSAGGLAMQVSYQLAQLGAAPRQLGHRYAVGYPAGRYGSQAYHRAQSGLDIAGIQALVDAHP